MSTIVGRALPDARDGLKPVHRRILYAMHELGLTPDRPYRKCARVVGDVLGKYHPHGDKAVYDALVRLVQTFSTRYPLLQGHGNFGSVDNDPPAAMRYTETRLSPVGDRSLLSEISHATVDFIPNFDNSQQEPVVLPAQLPFLLLNGCSGIAVGMATNVPPHNLGELVDATIALIDRPDLSDEKLLQILPGPDFPTGGEIVDTQGIEDAYRKGRGSIALRGVTTVEEIPGGRGRQRRTALVVTELPYQVNKSAWLEKVANLVNQGRIHGISDLRDESDRDGIRVVIELKREATPDEVLQQLYRQTELKTTFGAILLAIVDGQPQQLGIRDLLRVFLEFRETTLTRQFTHERTQATQRLELVSGLINALDNLDATIEILRQAPDGGSAKARMVEQLTLTERQADAVLAMPLRRLTGLERQNLEAEQADLQTRIAQFDRLLSERHELLKALKKELRELKRRYGDERRTRILTAADMAAAAEAAAAETATQDGEAVPTVVEVSDRGYVRRWGSLRSFQRQAQHWDLDALASQTKAASLTDCEEVITARSHLTSDREILAITRTGKAFTVLIGEVPAVTRREPRGVPLVTLLPASVREQAVQGGEDAIADLAREVVSTVILTPDWVPDPVDDPPSASPGDRPPPTADPDAYLVVLTRHGRINRVPLGELIGLTGRGLTLLKLKDDDEVIAAVPARVGDCVVVAISSGRLLSLRLDDTSFPLKKRTTQGLAVTRLGKKERLIGCIALPPSTDVVLVTARGYGKRLPVSTLRAVRCGELGVQALRFATKTDALAAIAPATTQSVITAVSDRHQAATVALTAFPVVRKDDPGQRVFAVPGGEMITAVTSLDQEEA